MKNQNLKENDELYRWDDTPDDLYCPFVCETDNPEYSLEKTEDAVAVCAKNVFGIPSLYPWQRLAIANILDAVHAVEARIEAEQTELKNKGGEDSDKDAKTKLLQKITSNPEEEKITSLYDEDGIMRGRQIILLPTGAGKSLCFQVPALLLDGPTVIIYPLLALMSDQFRRMA